MCAERGIAQFPALHEDNLRCKESFKTIERCCKGNLKDNNAQAHLQYVSAGGNIGRYSTEAVAKPPKSSSLPTDVSCFSGLGREVRVLGLGC